MVPSSQQLVVVLLALTLPEVPSWSAAVAGEGEKIVFLQQWGKRGREPGEFRSPIGIAINAADEVFITDHMNHRIQKFDTQGKLLAQFSVLPNPGGIALDKAGNIYLTHFQASSA